MDFSCVPPRLQHNRLKVFAKLEATFKKFVARNFIQEGPPIGGAVRNATSLIPQRLSYIILGRSYHLFRKRSCISVDCDNNATAAINVM